MKFPALYMASGAMLGAAAAMSALHPESGWGFMFAVGGFMAVVAAAFEVVNKHLTE